MPSKVEAIDHLIDALAGKDMPRQATSVASSINALAGLIESGEISIGGGGGGSSILRCKVSVAGTGASGDPYVGHIDNAAKFLDALDSESSYDPIVAIAVDMIPCLPTTVFHMTQEYDGFTAKGDGVQAYLPGVKAVYSAFMFSVTTMGEEERNEIVINLSGKDLVADSYTVADDVISFEFPTDDDDDGGDTYDS